MIDWSKTYEIDYLLYRVDERTWAEAEKVDGLRSAHVERATGGDMESASISMTSTSGFEIGYYRLTAMISQERATEQFHIGTFHCLSPSGAVDMGFDVLSVNGRSTLFPASAKRLDRGCTASAGCDGVDFAASMLSSCLRAPVNATGTFTLDDPYTFDIGSTVLDAAWKVLDAGGWCLQIDGRGAVTVAEKPGEPSLLLDSANAKLLLPEVAHEADFSGVFNTYTAIDGTRQAKAVNDDPSSPTSVPSLGFEHDAPFDTSPMRVNGETLQAYAERKLAEASAVPDYRTYTREYQPDVLPYSLVRGSIPSVLLDGDMRVCRQAFDCARGKRLTVTERAFKEVFTWRA